MNSITYSYREGDFEIKIISPYDSHISQMCFVFYKNNYLHLENGIIHDAIFIDANSIELEIISPNGFVMYFYYYADTKKFIRILNEDSEILFIRKCNKEAEDMETLVYASEEIFEQAIFC